MSLIEILKEVVNSSETTSAVDEGLKLRRESRKNKNCLCKWLLLLLVLLLVVVVVGGGWSCTVLSFHDVLVGCFYNGQFTDSL